MAKVILGKNEYEVPRGGIGPGSNSKPSGRKARGINILRRKLAENANNYWQAYGQKIFGVNRPVKLIYWT